MGAFLHSQKPGFPPFRVLRAPFPVVFSQILLPCKQSLFNHQKKRLAHIPRERLWRGYNPLRVFFTQIAWLPPPIPAVTPNFAVIPNLIRDLYKIAPILRLCILHIFLYLHTLQKVSATYRKYNVAKQRAEALECRLKTRQKSICAVRTRQRSLNKNPSLCKAAGNQLWVPRKEKTYENTHWSGTYSAA